MSHFKIKRDQAPKKLRIPESNHESNPDAWVGVPMSIDEDDFAECEDAESYSTWSSMEEVLESNSSPTSTLWGASPRRSATAELSGWVHVDDRPGKIKDKFEIPYDFEFEPIRLPQQAICGLEGEGPTEDVIGAPSWNLDTTPSSLSSLQETREKHPSRKEHKQLRQTSFSRNNDRRGDVDSDDESQRERSGKREEYYCTDFADVGMGTAAPYVWVTTG